MFTNLNRALCLTFATAALGYDIQQLFASNLSSEAEIVLRTDSSWTEKVQQRWTTWAEPEYTGAIKVATAEDVQNIVQIANANNISILATGGGHGASFSLDSVNNGVNIDLSNFQYARLDASNEYLTIGGSTKFDQVWETLQPVGKEITTGTAACVGTLGATFGAGIGPLQGRHGLTLDALVSVKLVTASGDLITASTSENSDLFWGIRGAGFNFGIVVEAVLKTSDATYGGNVLEGDLLFPASANQSIFETLKTFDENLPPELSIILVFTYNATSAQSSIIVNFIYFGPEDQGRQYAQPFIDLSPTRSNFTTLPLPDLYEALFFGSGRSASGTACKDNQYLNSAGQGLKQTHVATYEQFFGDFTKFLSQHTQVAGSFVASRFPNDAVVAIPDEDTAYPYRDIKTHLLWQHIYPDDPALDQAVETFLAESQNLFTTTSGYDNFTLYNNYAHGNESAETLYSARKLERLTALKRTWDPDQLFSHYNAIPLD